MTKSNVDLCLEYILDTESEDFSENPSDNHVYFHAYAASFGLEKARAMLTNALKKLGDSTYFNN